MKYNESDSSAKYQFYVGMATLIANIPSSIGLGMAISNGDLEKSLIWGGATFINSLSSLINLPMAYNKIKERKS